MNKERRRFITALRSGVHEQCRGLLKDDRLSNRYCAVGVAFKAEGVDITEQINGKFISDAFVRSEEDSYNLGLSIWPIKAITIEEAVYITQLNDIQKKTFEQIADELEESGDDLWQS